VSTRTTAIKRLKINQEPKMKLFISDLVAQHCESVEQAVNDWLNSNEGKIKVYDIVSQRQNQSLGDDGISCIVVVYCDQ